MKKQSIHNYKVSKLKVTQGFKLQTDRGLNLILTINSTEGFTLWTTVNNKGSKPDYWLMDASCLNMFENEISIGTAYHEEGRPRIEPNNIKLKIKYN